MKGLKLAVALVIFSFVLGCASKYMTSGKVYMQLEEYDKAIAQFKEEIKANPNNASAYVWLGRAYVATKQFEEACKSFDKAKEISPSRMDKDFKKQPYYYWAIYFNAGASHMKMKDWEMARKRLVQASVLEPDTTTTYISLAWVYRNLNQRDSVIASYKKIIELAPQNINARVDLARYYMDEQNYRAAIPVLQKIVELDSTNSDAFYLLGVCYSFEAKDTTEDVKNEYYAKALAYFDKATTIDPQNEDAYFNWGTLLYKQRRYEEAIEPFKKAVEIVPDDKEAIIFLGAAYLMSKHYKEAVEAYTRAIELDPNDPELYTNRASAYWQLGMRDKADADIRRAEELKKE
ncbi:MAG TPA: tetratricopeptide repeat protein [bacterium (Candidatus Stahlbacteria)]|nr:tetratricopeptide repeat protein [Candidatus Stahlbacteria bacterium]